jgi:hypothetical protein
MLYQFLKIKACFLTIVPWFTLACIIKTIFHQSVELIQILKTFFMLYYCSLAYAGSIYSRILRLSYWRFLILYWGYLLLMGGIKETFISNICFRNEIILLLPYFFIDQIRFGLSRIVIIRLCLYSFITGIFNGWFRALSTHIFSINEAFSTRCAIKAWITTV